MSSKPIYSYIQSSFAPGASDRQPPGPGDDFLFYTYHQNNSGGQFHRDAKFDVVTIVAATSPEDADRRAEAIGIYFDGVASATDCECCGDRWGRTIDGSGHDQPLIYGRTPEAHVAASGRYDRACVVVHYPDGSYRRVELVPPIDAVAIG
jgi:hypothetical protein